MQKESEWHQPDAFELLDATPLVSKNTERCAQVRGSHIDGRLAALKGDFTYFFGY